MSTFDLFFGAGTPGGFGRENLFLLAFFAFIGGILGSFYTALASRVLYFFYGPGRKQKGRWVSLLTRPSFCMNCGTRLKPWQLIPAFSFLIQRGKCSRCHTPIGFYTYLGEIFPALLLPLIVISGRPPLEGVALIAMVGHLYTSIATDLRFFLLDHENAFMIFLFGNLAILFSADPVESARIAYLTAAMVFLFFFLFRLLAGADRFGTGDVILSSVLSLGVPGVWSLFFIQLSATLSVFYAVLTKKGRKDPLPFGVFLAFGFMGSLTLRHIQEIWIPGFFYR